jgi:four helix bundle protein
MQTCQVFRGFPYELKRVVSQQISCVDSVHRKIAEGYCRRSIHEYLDFLNIALGSLGESVSGLQVYKASSQLSEDEFIRMNDLAFKLENSLLRLVESLKLKREKGNWIDHLIVKESNEIYGRTMDDIFPVLQHSSTPTLQYSKEPLSSSPEHPSGSPSAAAGPTCRRSTKSTAATCSRWRSTSACSLR